MSNVRVCIHEDQTNTTHISRPQLLPAIYMLLLFTFGLIIYFRDIMIVIVKPNYLIVPQNVTKTQIHRCHLAILISGQIQRFIYKDQFGILIQQNETDETFNLPCQLPWLINVFIVLHNGTMSKAWDPRIDKHGPPYIFQSTVDDIYKWYIQRGADNVILKILNDTDMTIMENMMETYLKNVINTTLFSNIISNDIDKEWHRHLRMFYLRHCVFGMTFEVNKYYDIFTYWRDDNYFLEPLNLNKVIVALYENKAVIAVDKYCTMGHGQLSDKIYVTNLEGGKLIFGGTFNQFKYKMAGWLHFAYVRMIKNIYPPFQCEAYLTQLIKTVQYIKVDLHRADIRYIHGKLCASPKYIRCTPELKETDFIHCTQSKYKQTTRNTFK